MVGIAENFPDAQALQKRDNLPPPGQGAFRWMLQHFLPVSGGQLLTTFVVRLPNSLRVVWGCCCCFLVGKLLESWTCCNPQKICGPR